MTEVGKVSCPRNWTAPEVAGKMTEYAPRGQGSETVHWVAGWTGSQEDPYGVLTGMCRRDEHGVGPKPSNDSQWSLRSGSSLRAITVMSESGSGEKIWCYTSKRFSPLILDSWSGSDEFDDRENLHEVRIIDNDYNTYREVMDITMLVLRITEEQAFAVAWEVDHLGSCVVAIGPRQEAEAIASAIRIIGIEVRVSPVDDKRGMA